MTALSLATSAGHSMAAPAAQAAGGSLAAIFAGGVVGAWYDPSDRATLYQDHAGTTPVTALEQTVALMLDKSRGLVRGAELNALGANGVPVGTTETDNGDGSFTYAQATPSNNDRAQYNFAPISTGRWYEARVVLSAPVATTARVRLYQNNPTFSTVADNIAAVGASQTTLTVIGYFAAGFIESGILIYPDSSGATGKSVRVHSISFRELPGLHVGQLTAGQRPTLSARKNLLTKTDQLNDAVWTKVGLTAASVSGVTTLTEDTSTGAHSVSTANTMALQIGGFATHSAIVKCGVGTRNFRLQFNNAVMWGGGNPNVTFNLGTGSVTTSLGATGTLTDIGDGEFYVTATSPACQAAGSTGLAAFMITGGTGSYTGDGVSTLLVRNLQAEFGPTATRYQRVNTATDYDSAGFPVYLRFEGDDGIFTPYLPAGQAFPFTLACAAQVSGDPAASGAAFGVWGGSPPYYEIQKSSSANRWNAYVRGTVNYSNSETVGVNGVPHVLMADFTAASVDLLMDGTNPTAATTQDNAVGTLTDIRIGNGGIGLFAGQFFGAVAYFGTMPAAQRSQVKNWLASKSQAVVA